ncbi:MAG: class I SAM-dependent methyltransferase [Rhizobium sp.]|nr:class I SAM-dependent methyltransferase [Rhizobium sp.]
MTHSKQQKFWNRIAGRYAARPLKDVAAYEAMLADVASHLKPSDRVLELGCGTGGTAIRLAVGVAHWTATDFSSEMIDIARAKPAGDNLSFVVADAGSAFDGGPFDAICAFNVLHLVEDHPAALARIFANLKPGGLLITKTWCFADMPLKLRALFSLLRVVGMFPAATALTVSQLRQAIVQAGFEIAEERIFGKYPQNPYIVARRPELADP